MSTLKEQIAARRAEVKKTATPIKGQAQGQQARPVASDDSLSEERTFSGQIKKAVRSGMSSSYQVG
jgi:transposase